jgi:hypothetical protein
VDDGRRSPPEAPGRVADAVPAAGPLAMLQGHVSRHPYATVAAAVGIGYALGGGIFTPLTSRLLRLGVRIGIRTALLPILKAELSELADAFISDDNEPGEQT